MNEDIGCWDVLGLVFGVFFFFFLYRNCIYGVCYDLVNMIMLSISYNLRKNYSYVTEMS